MKKLIGILVIGIAVVSGGCSSNPTKEQIGTVTGAVVGGVVGSAVTGGSTVGTVGGAAAGAYAAMKSANA